MGTVPTFPRGALMVTLHGQACLQNGVVLHDGVVPSYALTSFFLDNKRFAMVLPQKHNALFMLKDSQSFCVNVLPPHMIHDSALPDSSEQHFLEPLTITGLEVLPCEHIRAQRFAQAAISVECIVSRYVIMEDYVLVEGKVITTHYHSDSMSKTKQLVNAYFNEEQQEA